MWEIEETTPLNQEPEFWGYLYLAVVMAIFQVILFVLQMSLGSINWGIVYIPMYLFLAMCFVELHLCITWLALAIIVTFTVKLNGERGLRTQNDVLVLLVMESMLLIFETLLACSRLMPDTSEPEPGNVYSYLTAFHRK